VYTPEEFKNMYNSREFFRKEIIEKGVKLYERGS
ncbi:MAG: nucleotidyltransferase domain-containing protein, partial [Thermodesulfobacteriota bacterium]